MRSSSARNASRFASLRETWTISASRCWTGACPVVKTAVRRPCRGCHRAQAQVDATSAPRTSPTADDEIRDRDAERVQVRAEIVGGPS
jgi:hypothetical protein